jgi:hypothetical protein
MWTGSGVPLPHVRCFLVICTCTYVCMYEYTYTPHTHTHTHTNTHTHTHTHTHIHGHLHTHQKTPNMSHSTATSTSTSSNTTIGDLPPSSSETPRISARLCQYYSYKSTKVDLQVSICTLFERHRPAGQYLYFCASDLPPISSKTHLKSALVR